MSTRFENLLPAALVTADVSTELLPTDTVDSLALSVLPVCWVPVVLEPIMLDPVEDVDPTELPVLYSPVVLPVVPPVLAVTVLPGIPAVAPKDAPRLELPTLVGPTVADVAVLPDDTLVLSVLTLLPVLDDVTDALGPVDVSAMPVLLLLRTVAVEPSFVLPCDTVVSAVDILTVGVISVAVVVLAPLPVILVTCPVVLPLLTLDTVMSTVVLSTEEGLVPGLVAKRSRPF